MSPLLRSEPPPSQDWQPPGFGRVYWLTGLSASGKTTLAKRLFCCLRNEGGMTVLLDGDRLRAILGQESGFTRDERLRLALTYARLCRELAEQNLDVVCATISMFHEVRDWNRANIPGYLEIFLNVPLEERERRDPKGIYAGYRQGTHGNLAGIDQDAEEPMAPDIKIDNYGSITPEKALELIWEFCLRHRKISP